ncbi:MAG: tetratricopeptide repeat protein [Saprospiraceae bacterium]
MNLNFRNFLFHKTANKKLAFSLFIGSFFPANSFAQHSEVEARLQGVFIEANKEKLLGNYDKAAELFEQVLLKDPKMMWLHLSYQGFERSKTLRRSCQIRKKATSIDPENLWYTLYLGDLYHSMERYTEAADVFSGFSKIS